VSEDSSQTRFAKLRSILDALSTSPSSTETRQARVLEAHDLLSALEKEMNGEKKGDEGASDIPHEPNGTPPPASDTTKAATRGASEGSPLLMAEVHKLLFRLAHDLKEPARGILAFTEFLFMEHRDELSADAAHHLAYIQSGAQRLSRQLSALESLARASSQPLQRAHQPMVTPLRRALDALDPLRTSRQGVFRVEGRLPELVCDAELMSQAFYALIHNSFIYTNEHPHVLLTIDDTESGAVRFSLLDEGMGIDPPYLDRVFELFERLHSWESIEGAGVGLTLTRVIIERHGGRIWAENNHPKGTIIRWTLPLEPPSPPLLDRD